MSKELTVKKDIVTEHDLSVIEQVVMQGDLSKLTPIQRVTYYNKVCDSLGLNPYTRPFDYISLNGKLTLYAKKDATEQLRQVKKISIISLEGKMIDDLYIVVAKASTGDGRMDQSTGAVNIGNLKGEQKANAIMKAETKAKRRVTLSISGLGWTDEMEIESISNAQKVEIDIETGEMIQKQEKIDEKISKQQVEELSNMLASCEPEVVSRFESFIKNPPMNANSLADIPVSQFSTLRNMVKKRYEEAIAKISASMSSKDTEESISFDPEEFEMKDAG
jgi:hypothetical protein